MFIILYVKTQSKDTRADKHTHTHAHTHTDTNTHTESKMTEHRAKTIQMYTNFVLYDQGKKLDMQRSVFSVDGRYRVYVRYSSVYIKVMYSSY